MQRKNPASNGGCAGQFVFKEVKDNLSSIGAVLDLCVPIFVNHMSSKQRTTLVILNTPGFRSDECFPPSCSNRFDHGPGGG